MEAMDGSQDSGRLDADMYLESQGLFSSGSEAEAFGHPQPATPYDGMQRDRPITMSLDSMDLPAAESHAEEVYPETQDAQDFTNVYLETSGSQAQTHGPAEDTHHLTKDEPSGNQAEAPGPAERTHLLPKEEPSGRLAETQGPAEPLKSSSCGVKRRKSI